nr:hypothetical protein [uncultured Sphingobacterium sp.]
MKLLAKSEVGEVKKYDNLQDFYNDNNNEAKYADKTKKYYKL